MHYKEISLHNFWCRHPVHNLTKIQLEVQMKHADGQTEIAFPVCSLYAICAKNAQNVRNINIQV